MPDSGLGRVAGIDREIERVVGGADVETWISDPVSGGRSRAPVVVFQVVANAGSGGLTPTVPD